MSDVRTTFAGETVLMAPERGKRPNAFRTYPSHTDPKEDCPFCPGHEESTPPTLLSLGDPWRLRVISNLYPAVQENGAHEVIVETREHEMELVDFSEERLVELFSVYQKRMKELEKRYRHVFIFKNHGHASGASLSHPHSQVIAFHHPSPQVRRELDVAEKHFETKGHCLYCEASSERRIVENHIFAAVAPYASRSPYETLLLPKTHSSSFTSAKPEELKGMAEALHQVLTRYKTSLASPPLSFWLHTAPQGHTKPESYHWHLEILPKLEELGGFEWGSGYYINSVDPDDAARQLQNQEEIIRNGS